MVDDKGVELEHVMFVNIIHWLHRGCLRGAYATIK